jgi:hypothetical protein
LSRDVLYPLMLKRTFKLYMTCASLYSVKIISGQPYEWYQFFFVLDENFNDCAKLEPTILCKNMLNLKPKWTSNHQCTSWLFCPLDGLHFFIQHQMGFIIVHFFLPLIVVLFFGLFFVTFFLNLISHIVTLLTFLPSWVLYQSWYY